MAISTEKLQEYVDGFYKPNLDAISANELYKWDALLNFRRIHFLEPCGFHGRLPQVSSQRLLRQLFRSQPQQFFRQLLRSQPQQLFGQLLRP